ncbi:DUF6891 domain-containing protein [Glycomyces algeriensis]|uniref:DUF6891 domain-containing protein n=1 Tax=Glycomyces algeriensis TaxID=256037 RepID=A0A9W6LG58_9ACTN|nr:hypothetical protein [Glycomyces algeriensis]MDA1366083.1 hypothetical protein [Glycomyces algeriensis]MDR7349150.1 hypothetical protein [Glycomyces algeriensis]GLI41850.1 hypothetical protein GALLR39Z86_17000 [Glycomyces algeriensis]
MSETPDEPLAIRGYDDRNRTFAHLSADALGERVRGLDDGSLEWIVVQRVPDLPYDTIQAGGGSGSGRVDVSYRVGDEPWLEASLPVEAAAAVFVAWARNEPGWEGAHPWEPAEWWDEEPVPAPSPEAAAETTVLAAKYLEMGYLSFDRMVQDLEEMSEADPPITRAQAREILAPMWRERVAEQAGWGVTDCDRLTEAFAELDRGGIVAREHFACCQRCGTTEIWDEADPEHRGYVFFHMQDTESAHDGVLYLAYGSRSDLVEETLAVGHDVVKTLQAHGFQTAWDGSERTRIRITDLEWRKRLQ